MADEMTMRELLDSFKDEKEMQQLDKEAYELIIKCFERIYISMNICEKSCEELFFLSEKIDSQKGNMTGQDIQKYLKAVENLSRNSYILNYSTDFILSIDEQVKYFTKLEKSYVSLAQGIIKNIENLENNGTTK